MSRVSYKNHSAVVNKNLNVIKFLHNKSDFPTITPDLPLNALRIKQFKIVTKKKLMQYYRLIPLLKMMIVHITLPYLKYYILKK